MILPATVTVNCATRPRPGSYTLISATSFTWPTDWSLTVNGLEAGYALRATESALLLDIIPTGTTILIR